MDAARRHPLSRREREILRWSCRGKTYAEIALITGLSNASIKTYLDTARRKLNVVNLIQACAVAVAIGVLTPDDIMGEQDRQAADRAASAFASDRASRQPPPQTPRLDRRRRPV
jgi:DNA-binding CsgD family transcriptional regulator